MKKYNEQCLTIYQGDAIGKPNKVNGLMTVGTIADPFTPVYVIIQPLSANIPLKRVLAASDGAGLVNATISGSLLNWFRPGESYIIMLEKAGFGTLYDFTANGGPSGNAIQVTTLHECENADFILKAREDAECLSC